MTKNNKKKNKVTLGSTGWLAAIAGVCAVITITLGAVFQFSTDGTGVSTVKPTAEYPSQPQSEPILTITLDTDNLVAMRDEVTPATVQKALNEFYAKFDYKKPIYFFLDTPGGDVSSGLVLAQFLKSSPQNIICIAKQAQSMGFLLLQSCKTRYVTESTLLMAHELGSSMPQYIILPDLRKLLQDLNNEQDYLNDIMASRIGISSAELQAKMTPMWITHGGKVAVKANLADKVVLAICSKELFESQVDGPSNDILAQLTGIKGPVTKVSGCPL